MASRRQRAIYYSGEFRRGPRPGESDFDFRQRMARYQADIGGSYSFGPEFEVQLAEDKALIERREQEKAMTRRRLGPRGYGATVLTSPLGVTGPAPGAMRSLLGTA
jgi:hypothetical protein